MINLVAKKIGMSHIYKDDGTSVPFTMIKLYESCLIEVINNPEKDFNNVLIGFDKLYNIKKQNKPVSGVFKKKNIHPYKKIYGCKIEKSSTYKVGDEINIESHFKEGDIVDVRGSTIGKGFAGVMKRHNFRGLEASHGVSVSHRSHGSTGQRQDPGKVFKGKKMAGHMGVDKITVKNLEVLIINKHNNTIAVKGSIPGLNGSDVVIKITK